MGVIIKKRIHVPEGKSIRALVFIKLFAAIASGLVITIWSLYINSFVNNPSTTGFISGLLTFVSFISFFAFIPIIQKSSKENLFFFSLILAIISYFLFSIVKSFSVFLTIAIILTAIQAINITTFGVIFKDKSRKKSLTKNIGILLTFANIGFVIGPLIAGYLASVYGNRLIFALASLFLLISLLIFKFTKIHDSHKQKPDKDVFKNFLNFFTDKNRIIAYILAGGVQFWWILIYLFMPLLIVQSGISEKIVGIFLFAVAFPLILTEYLFSTLVHKYGFRKIFRVGFIIPAILSIVCFFISDIYTIMSLIILASFGLAMLEPTTEAYLLNMLKRSEMSKFFGPYNTTFTVNQFIAKIVPSLLMLVLPFKFVFLIFGFFMLIFFLIARKA